MEYCQIGKQSNSCDRKIINFSSRQDWYVLNAQVMCLHLSCSVEVGEFYHQCMVIRTGQVCLTSYQAWNQYHQDLIFQITFPLDFIQLFMAIFSPSLLIAFADTVLSAEWEFAQGWNYNGYINKAANFNFVCSSCHLLTMLITNNQMTMLTISIAKNTYLKSTHYTACHEGRQYRKIDINIEFSQIGWELLCTSKCTSPWEQYVHAQGSW